MKKQPENDPSFLARILRELRARPIGGGILPTRDGVPAGKSTERRMLEKAGGTAGYKKVFQTDLPSGTTTMLATKDGNPQFSTAGSSANGTLDSNDFLPGMDSGIVLMPVLATGTVAPQKYIRNTKVSKTVVNSGDKAKLVNRLLKSQGFVGKNPVDNSVPKTLYNDVAQKCPASLFTGRMRLYVQCLYGALDPVLGGVELVLVEGSPPAIKVNGVLIDINCGIYLESEFVPGVGMVTKASHWIISMTEGKAYHLTWPQKMGWIARQMELRPVDLGYDPVLSNRCEAYLLAYSVPNKTDYIDLSLLSRPLSSMGYGWHFDWLGHVCDIATTVSFDSGGGVLQNSSNHLRCTIKADRDQGSAVASISDIKTAQVWSNHPHTHVITYPLWNFSGMQKIGGTSGTPSGTATYYVFYLREGQDEVFPGSSILKECVWDAKAVAVPIGADRFPAYLNPGTLLIQGGDSMDYRWWNPYSGADVSLSCGADKLLVRSFSRTKQCITATPAIGPVVDPLTQPWYTGGTMQGRGPTFTWDYGQYLPVGPLSVVGNPYEGPISVYGGVDGQASTGTAAQGSAEWPPGNYIAPPPMGAEMCSWSWSSFSSVEIGTIALISAIPLYDSQAIYMLSSATTNATHTGTDNYVASGQGFWWPAAWGWLDNSPPLAYFGHAARMNNPTAYPGVSTTRPSVATPITKTEIFGVNNYGVINNITIPSTGAFFNVTYSVVPVIMTASASAGGDACYAAQANIDKENNPAYVSGISFAYIGWG